MYRNAFRFFNSSSAYSMPYGPAANSADASWMDRVGQGSESAMAAWMLDMDEVLAIDWTACSEKELRSGRRRLKMVRTWLDGLSSDRLACVRYPRSRARDLARLSAALEVVVGLGARRRAAA